MLSCRIVLLGKGPRIEPIMDVPGAYRSMMSIQERRAITAAQSAMINLRTLE